MDQELKKGLRDAVRRAEIGLAKSALRWKYGKEEGPEPTEPELARQADHVARQARLIVSRRGKNAWEGLKQAYREARRTGKGDRD